MEIFKKLVEKNEFYKSAMAGVMMYLSGLYRNMGKFDLAKKYYEDANKTFAEFTIKMQKQSSSESPAS